MSPIEAIQRELQPSGALHQCLERGVMHGVVTTSRKEEIRSSLDRLINHAKSLELLNSMQKDTIDKLNAQMQAAKQIALFP